MLRKKYMLRAVAHCKGGCSRWSRARPKTARIFRKADL